MANDQAFREDIIDRLARIETLLSSYTDHSKRIASLERWRIYIIGLASGGGVGLHYLIQLFTGTVLGISHR